MATTRFNNFIALYRNIFPGTNNPSFDYSKDNFVDLSNYFLNNDQLDLATDKDSVYVAIGKCEATANVPQTNGMTLIFYGVKAGTLKEFVTITKSPSPNEIMQLDASNNWIQQYISYEKGTLVTNLNNGEIFNHISHVISANDLSNTIHIGFSFKDWYDFFVSEPIYQKNKSNSIDGISAVLALYGEDGDHGVDDPGGKYRAYRLHIIFQYSIKNVYFSIDNDSDSCCRGYIRSLQRQLRQAQERQRSGRGGGKKAFNARDEANLEAEIKSLKMRIKATGGNPNSGGGDNGQLWP